MPDVVDNRDKGGLAKVNANIMTGVNMGMNVCTSARRLSLNDAHRFVNNCKTSFCERSRKA